jgi:protoheme IX farnesyltransferase
MLLDHDIDSKMTRTANRPLPRGSIRPVEAFLFGGLLSAAGLFLSFALDLAFGLVVASGFVIDLLVYTTWLKRRTPLSIIFGGVSGGMPVLAGRVLGLGRVDAVGILLAGSVLLWIPSHILTLATRYAADYERAGVPVWPNVYGSRATRLLIAGANLVNTLVLTGAGLLLRIQRLALLALLAMSIGMFMLSAWQLLAPSERRNWLLFKAASLYMLASSLLVTLGTIV